MRFVDANVLLSAAVDQDASQHARAIALMSHISETAEDVFVPDLVLAEVAANLQTSRLGRMPRATIRDFLMAFLQLPNVHLRDKTAWSRIFMVYVDQNVDLTDAYIVVAMQDTNTSEVYSFDTDFDHIPGITRLEP